MLTRGFTLLLSVIGIFGGNALETTSLENVPNLLCIRTDGSVTGKLAVWSKSSESGPLYQQVHFQFGLPKTPPVQRWQEDQFPIYHTCWESKGIRYTQTVLMSSLADGTSQALSILDTNSILMVRIAGENTTSEYAEASAEFAVQIEGQSRQLELKDNVAYLAQPDSILLATIDIPAEGIRQTAGPTLTFQGNIPPGHKGSMTIIIPLHKQTREVSQDMLRDLDFENEARRIKRALKSQRESKTAPRLPIVFEEAIIAP